MKTRNRNLDALRAVAILLVLGRHFEYFRLWSQVGWAGVDLFFVLSGFLISGLLFAEWKQRGSIGIARFYVRRGLKIYPAFYVFLAMTAAAEGRSVSAASWEVRHSVCRQRRRTRRDRHRWSSVLGP